ncbi:PfkB family carbohydrate kinase [Alicyclobacillus ferrooxydans]|uniref:Carbohydrate kinase PfkB domain-containing protein n=1 Tax=Alicyclobacillus ferrooxydans TaxID=471514 RepID=A0A0P9CNF7_9BACL|nr:PfkB family carbohydrate kinase [Alicyclobacillus ferrooxydans]KPV44425.1 hypothetical protein AN477_07355 [Alicyclobacillus ferrooxydans]
MFDVVAIGELLIDFTPVSGSLPKTSDVGNNGSARPCFEQNPGGAPANVAVAAAQMGKRAAFIGKVGEDAFGRFLRETLESRGVDVSGLLSTNAYPTTLAFVHLDTSGERSFSFYRNPSADVMLEPDDVDPELLSQTKLFHFGSVSMTADPSRTATLASVRAARNAGAIISYDPNLRLSLWKDQEAAKEVILGAMQYADVLKVSDEELRFLTGETGIEDGIEVLRRYHQCAITLVTLGAEGCYYSAACGSGSVPSYAVHAIDTTGAGDAFVGAFVSELLDALDELERPGRAHGVAGISASGPVPVSDETTAQGKFNRNMLNPSVLGRSTPGRNMLGRNMLGRNMLGGITEERLQQAIRFANTSGALTTTKRGGIPALPTKREVFEYMQHHLPLNEDY